MTSEEYIKGIPIELRRAISGFDNDIRLGIFLALRKHGELPFSDLSERLGMKMDKAKLHFHLRKLTESALIEHRYRHQFGNEKFSFYATTKFGENLWDSIATSLRPPSPIVHMEDSSAKYLIQKIRGTLDIEHLAINDNSSLPIIAKATQKRRKMPEKFSDQVSYEKAVIEAGT